MYRPLGNVGVLIWVFGAAGALAPIAEGGYTPVMQSNRVSAISHERILEHVYGGDFVSDSSGLSLSNQSGVTVTRLDDAAVPAWSGKIVSARAVGAFSGKRRTSTYFGAAAGSNVDRFFNVSGRRFNVAGETSVGAAGTSELVFGTGRGRRQATFSSVAASNRDGEDHLVEYEVRGVAGQQASLYLLCWEDKFAGRGDRNYNDLIVEIEAGDEVGRGALAKPLLIPLPPAALPGLSGLIGLAFYLRIHRRHGIPRLFSNW